jgi:ABC-2 type transport system permease protein
MNKILVIIKREYLTRVRKKSFIIMTILAPLLFAGLMIVPPLLMMNDSGDFKKIAVVEDKTEIFRGVLKDRDDIDFVYIEDKTFEELKASFDTSGYYGILWISPKVMEIPNAVQLLSKKQPPMGLLQYIEGSMKKEIEKNKLLGFNIENLDEIMKSIESNVSIQTISLNSSGEIQKTNTGIAMGLAYVFGFLMYMLVFIFGAQVMRGVIEEKTSRIIEVIISSVKPYQLMMGKIIGIAMVGLTQFLIWVAIMSATLVIVNSTLLADKNVMEQISGPGSIMANNPEARNAIEASSLSPQLNKLNEFVDSAMNQPWGLIIFSFVFYFITGYLLYASMFAAIGSAVDNETETQQFMLPVTIPIIIALMVAMGTMQNPESSLAFWCSMIPLTSPIVMMARIPFGVPPWQIAASMSIMLVSFMFFVWMASKIYRVGILMYGKKASWKEMIKWMRYSA